MSLRPTMASVLGLTLSGLYAGAACSTHGASSAAKAGAGASSDDSGYAAQGDSKSGPDAGGAGASSSGTGTVGASGSSSGGSSGIGSSSGGSGSDGGGSSSNGGSSSGGGTGDGGVTVSADAGDAGLALSLQNLKQAAVNWRFGMFIHFGILTYTGSWAQANLDITQFNPTGLDPAQWASAAKAAGMKFGVLTSRHHDGFALWPSTASNFNVGHIPWQGGQGDVVRKYVDSFRAAGLLPALYYSIWDNTEGVGNGPVTAAQLSYLTTQLTELLTNYGPIPLLVLDGWGWKMGHEAVPFQSIHDLVKSLQPNILIVDHNGLQSPFDEDLVMFEEPKGAFSPVGNTWAAAQGNKINASGGNDWFWAPNIGNLMTPSTIVAGHLTLLGPRYTDFILNCPPNRQGLLDQSIVDILAQVGQTWTQSPAPPLPDQGIQNTHPYTPVSATATSGTASAAIDGLNDYARYTVWQSTSPLPQSITLDLGAVKPDVGFLGYLPPYANASASPTSAGAITTYVISVSADNSAFTQVSSGTWLADGKLQHATFASVAARYVRLQAMAASGGLAAATEITVGGTP